MSPIDEHWSERRSGNIHKPNQDIRDPEERDYARLVHSAAFRRLQGKTQVLGVGEDDFYRTRLTHSFEASQIGCGILRFLKRNKTNSDEVSDALPNETVLQTVILAHDLGHPPFGHGGESALAFVMRNHGGFEGNAQTLRIVSRLEPHTEGYGLDFTRRTLLGVLKYPAPYSATVRDVCENRTSEGSDHGFLSENWRPPKCYYDSEKDVVQWILDPFSARDKERFTSVEKRGDENGRTIHKSLDTSIMDLADEVAYATHDLEDATHLKMIDKNVWNNEVSPLIDNINKDWRARFELDDCSKLSDNLFSSRRPIRKKQFGELINAIIASTEVNEINDYCHSLLRYNVKLADPAEELVDILKKFVKEKVIFSTEVQTLEYKGQSFILELFSKYSKDPMRFLPKSTKEKISANSGANNERVICDHISGMTDEFATQMYERLHTPRRGSLFRSL